MLSFWDVALLSDEEMSNYARTPKLLALSSQGNLFHGRKQLSFLDLIAVPPLPCCQCNRTENHNHPFPPLEGHPIFQSLYSFSCIFWGHWTISDSLSGQATAHYSDRCNVASFAHLLPLKVNLLTREQKLLEQRLRLGETAFFVRNAHSCTGMALKQTDVMMNHVHDRAVSNGHLTHTLPRRFQLKGQLHGYNWRDCPNGL